MKKLLSLLALVLTICSTVQAQSLNLYSPVGTIGTVKGREAMVLDLGGTIGKVAVATMNVGAASVSDYGSDFNIADVNDPSKNGLTDGWYVPSKEELDALFDNLTFNEARTGLEWKVTESSTLQIPGSELTEGGEVYGYSGCYLTSTLEDGAYYNWGFQIDNRGHELKLSSTVEADGSVWWCHIRPFHKLSTANCTLDRMLLNTNLLSINDNYGLFTLEFVANTTIIYDNTVSDDDSEVDTYASYLPDQKTLHVTTVEKGSVAPLNYIKAYLVSAADSEEKAYAVYDSDTKTIYVCTSEKEFMAPSNFSYAFDNLKLLKEVRNIIAINTSNVTDMSGMFNNCYHLTSLDVSGFNTSNVTNMSKMFYDCNGLTSLDVSGFNTSNVTNMSGMFYCCWSLTSLDVSGFNTSNVTDMGNMFDGCRALTSLDVCGFNTTNVTSMYSMFITCSALTSLDVSGFDTSNVTNMNYMFDGCSALTSLDVSGFDTSNVTNMNYMFDGCSALTSLDVSRFDTSNVTDMNYMFKGCSALTSLDVSGFNTSNVTDMGKMFDGCSALTSLDVSGFNTTNVTGMNYMFNGCSALTSLDVSGLNTSNVTEMGKMFDGCSALTSLDVSRFDTSNVTNMNSMFNGCSALISLDVSGFNTTNVTGMYGMFESCRALTSLDVSGFNTSKVEWMDYMFYNCTALTELITGNDFRVINNSDYMFSNTASKSGKCSITCTKATMDAMIMRANDTKMNTSLFFWILLGEETPIDFIDGEEYTSAAGRRYYPLTYKRTFNNTDWQPLYVPFQMEYDDWKDDFDVAAITNFHEYSDANGNLTNVELEVRYVKEGKRLRFNTPYLIRAKSIGEKTITLNEEVLYLSESNSISCSSTERTYTFTGTYAPVTGLKTKGYIYLSGNKLCQADNDQQTLKAQRWYLTIEDRDAMLDEATPPALAKAMSIRLLDDDETTGIEEIGVLTSYNNDAVNCSNGVYDLSGRKQNALRQGINIVRKADGSVRKVMVK